MADEIGLLADEQVDQAAQDGRGAVGLVVSGLAKEECQTVSPVCCGGLQLIDDTAEQHRLAGAGAALDPKQAGVEIVSPLLKGGLLQDPAVRVPQQAALGVLDALFVEPGVRHVQVPEAERLFALGA